MMRRIVPLSTVALIAVLGASACSPVVRSHGYAPQAEALASIVPGVDSRASVAEKIGRPGMSGVFSDEGWYYVASTVEEITYNEPKVIGRRVVAVTFDANDTVASVNEYGIEEGRVIDLQRRTTPTFGREITVLQQLLGNIGVFTAGDFTTN